ncbi:hypothetical protein PpBr36_03755 [Pyricularia pennisetigena]|uniref:hypothetical protein n=1 Tax=Pyricularia pennisetigena TaxID=1578925 RepID=UPI0011520DFC|nr:hypothetical protein PpBr36_03755 [Pyricularia pennisetigena]TLS30229.1 hypothetical protein PpBr36_03755 [Pyricularia pennisetigena]
MWNDLSTLNCTILWCLRWLAQPPSLAGEQSNWRKSRIRRARIKLRMAFTHFGEPRRRLRPARQGVQPPGACLDRSGGLANDSTQATAWVRPSAGEPARKPPNLPNRFAPLPKNLQMVTYLRSRSGRTVL